jgi:hypothetical protein
VRGVVVPTVVVALFAIPVGSSSADVAPVQVLRHKGDVGEAAAGGACTKTIRTRFHTRHIRALSGLCATGHIRHKCARLGDDR